MLQKLPLKLENVFQHITWIVIVKVIRSANGTMTSQVIWSTTVTLILTVTLRHY